MPIHEKNFLFFLAMPSQSDHKQTLDGLLLPVHMRAGVGLLLKTQSQQGVSSYSNSYQEAQGPCFREQVVGLQERITIQSSINF